MYSVKLVKLFLAVSQMFCQSTHTIHLLIYQNLGVFWEKCSCFVFVFSRVCNVYILCDQNFFHYLSLRISPIYNGVLSGKSILDYKSIMLNYTSIPQ